MSDVNSKIGLAQRLVDAGLIGGAVLSGVATTGGVGAEPVAYGLTGGSGDGLIEVSLSEGDFDYIKQPVNDGSPHKVVPLYASPAIPADHVVADDRVFTVYDWAYSDPTGQEHYARTPERATALAAQGVKLTPVYTRESRAAAIKSVSSRSEAKP